MSKNYSDKNQMDPHSPENIELMPRDTASEARLLNYMIINDPESKRQSCQAMCQGQLDPWVFFHEPHRLVFLAVRALYQQGQTVCPDNISNWLFQNTRPELQKVIDKYMLKRDPLNPDMSAEERFNTISTHVLMAAMGKDPDRNVPTDPLLVGSRFTYQDLPEEETVQPPTVAVATQHPVYNQTAPAPVLDEEDVVNW